MPSLNNFQDFTEIIDPGFVEEIGDAELNGSGVIEVSGDKWEITSTDPVEVPMVDGSVAVFDTTGEFMGFKS